MTKYVISTMTNSVSYNWYDDVDGLPRKKFGITIHGGANLPSIRSGFGDMSRDGEGNPIWTAAGIVTPVSDENWAKLQSHPLFMKHLAAGHLECTSSDISGNHKAVSKITANMEKRDAHAQLTPETFKTRVKMKTPLELEQETAFRI